jgi:hypothetical protein
MRKDTTELIICQCVDQTPLRCAGCDGWDWREMPQPIATDEAKRMAERRVQGDSYSTVKGAWPSPPGNSRSGLLRSRTIRVHLKSHAPEGSSGASHTAEAGSPTGERAQASCVTLELKSEKVTATSMGLGALHKHGLRCCSRRPNLAPF